jgi:hypothetical protein
MGKNGDVLRQGSTTAVAATHLRKGAAWNWTAPLRGLVRASPVIEPWPWETSGIFHGFWGKFTRG